MTRMASQVDRRGGPQVRRSESEAPGVSRRLLLRLEAAAVRTVGRVARIAGGSGSVIGGKALLSVDRRALQRFAAGRTVCLVSGTNGKTTTTAMLTRALGQAGPVVTNSTGSNLKSGLVSALANAESTDGVAVLEVDEAVLPAAAKEAVPAVCLLLNLSKDQLDRYGEVRSVASRWRATSAALVDTVVVANADDPLVAWAAMAAPNVVWVATGVMWADDAAACPACGARLSSHLRDWACVSCDLRRPQPDFVVEPVGIRLPDGDHVRPDIQLPGRANMANAAMAIAAACTMGVDADAAAAALAGIVEIQGRYRRTQLGKVNARLLLAKNPAGWAELFEMLRPAPAPVLISINAREADGRDPSWLWDVPFERLAGRPVFATGERVADLAVRLHYAELDPTTISDGIATALAATDFDEIDVVANYTAFQDLLAGTPIG